MNMQYVKGQIVDYVPLMEPSAVMLRDIDRWYVLRTFANKEAKVMRTFDRRGISAYYPTVRSEKFFEIRRFGRVCGRVKRTVISPMFSGVIFIPDFQAALGGVKVDGVDGYLRMDKCFPYLTPQLMEQVRRLVALCNIPASRKRRLLAAGQPIHVVDGPFAEFAGKFEHLDSEGRLTVLIDIFGRMTPVTLDESQIEPA